MSGNVFLISGLSRAHAHNPSLFTLRSEGPARDPRPLLVDPHAPLTPPRRACSARAHLGCIVSTYLSHHSRSLFSPARRSATPSLGAQTGHSGLPVPALLAIVFVSRTSRPPVPIHEQMLTLRRTREQSLSSCSARPWRTCTRRRRVQQKRTEHCHRTTQFQDMHRWPGPAPRPATTGQLSPLRRQVCNSAMPLATSSNESRL